jgi:hypothetical protein
MIKLLANIKARTCFGLVAVVTILVRAGLYIFYRPVSYNDTASYRRSADAILNGWNTYDGTRLPGYPLFLAITGTNEHVYLAQLILGIVTTLLIFYIGWRVSGKAWFAALAALAHGLNLQQLFFEADLISESLTTFFVILTLAGVASLFSTKRETPLWKILLLALWIGIASAGATLVRPLFIFLPLFSIVFILLFWHIRLEVRWGSALVIGLVSLALIGTWVNFLHQRFNRWGLDTMTGYHLVQHTGAFFEYVPDKYAVIRDTFIRYRDERIAQAGSPANAIWDAIPALQQASGLSFYDLSDTLANISIQLIMEHPGLYLRSAWEGWLWFWKVPVYWSPANMPTHFVSSLMSGLVLVERGSMFLANLIFLGGSLALFWKRVRKLLKMDLFLWFVTASIWLTSILQTLPDHGDNPRFSVPIQSMVVFIALWWVVKTVKKLSEAREKK